MKRRGGTEILDSMLRSIGPGATKTHIMYKACLYYSQLKGYLSVLEKRGLIIYEKRTHLYKLTEKGLRFMNAFDKILELIPSTQDLNEGLENEAFVY